MRRTILMYVILLTFTQCTPKPPEGLVPIGGDYNKAISMANEVWLKKGFTNDDMDKLLNTNEQ